MKRTNSILPRLLTAEQAAQYIGYKSTAALRRLPIAPVQLATTGPGSAPKYDRHALDAWLDQLSGLDQAATPELADEIAEDAYATWKAQRTPR